MCVCVCACVLVCVGVVECTPSLTCGFSVLHFSEDLGSKV